jgi:hypothetical protein
MTDDTLSRWLHDAGLGPCFGGALPNRVRVTP